MGVDQPRDDLKDSREIMLPLPVKGFQLNFVNFAYKGICVMFTKRACQPSCPRSPSNPEGDVSKPAVANANCMVARSALVMALCYACYAFWVLEQPGSSLMSKMPVLEVLKAAAEHFDMDWHADKTYMGLFGGESPKALNLYSNNGPMVAKLARNMRGKTWMFTKSEDTQMVTRKASANRPGRLDITGGPKLKESQAYTPEFADAVLDAYLGSKSQVVIADLDGDSTPGFAASLAGPPPWGDLKLEEVLDFLRPQVGIPT